MRSDPFNLASHENYLIQGRNQDSETIPYTLVERRRSQSNAARNLRASISALTLGLVSLTVQATSNESMTNPYLNNQVSIEETPKITYPSSALSAIGLIGILGSLATVENLYHSHRKARKEALLNRYSLRKTFN